MILIIGKVPPPIGGVTIHVSRLCSHLKLLGLEYLFFDIRSLRLHELLFALYQSRVCHVHLSNPYAILSFVVLAKIFHVKTVITLHCDINFYQGLEKIASNIAVLLSNKPILLNTSSYSYAVALNKNSVLMSAFIPPSQHEALDNSVSCKLIALRERASLIVATNAYKYTLDAYGRELYGIIELIKHSACRNYALVLSDPSGTYLQHIINVFGCIPRNVEIISCEHSFYTLLDYVDVFVRNTTTDGDSISVREALHLGKAVYCTDVVNRPEGVVLYNDLSKVEFSSDNQRCAASPNVIGDLVMIYKGMQ